MIHRLFRRRPAAAQEPEAPAGTRVYAVGDIHGRFDLLERLHQMVAVDAADHAEKRKVLIYLGDYIDRGEDSCAVVDLLLQPAPTGFERVCLKGNHEESLLQFLEDEQTGPAWLAYGGAATLFSYRVEPPQAPFDPSALLRAQTALKQELPHAHAEFFRNLPLYHLEGDYIFVHAGLRPNVPIASQAAEDLLWIRDEFLLSEARFEKTVVHGHSITDRPDIRPNRIGIDTGAFASGHLTCAILDGAGRRFLATG